MMAKPTIRNLLIATDDYAWLEEQKEIVKKSSPDWNIYSLPPPHRNNKRNLYGNPKDYHYIRSGAATESGVYFHASMMLASQCIFYSYSK